MRQQPTRETLMRPLKCGASVGMLILAFATQVAAQSPPAFMGYRVGSLNPPLAELRCVQQDPVLRLCQAADGVIITLLGDTLVSVLQSKLGQSAQSPASQWRDQWQAYATKLFGPADSVIEDSTASRGARGVFTHRLTARWGQGMKTWHAQVVLSSTGTVGSVMIQVACRFDAAKRRAACSP